MSWKRLEAVSVAADLMEGEEARIADPLWLIGRQWQVGELTGDDAGSPIVVEASFETTPVTRVQPGDPGGPVVEREPGALPLEVAIEREDVRSGPAAVRLAAEAGLQLFRLLDAAGVPHAVRADLRAAHPLSLGADDGIDPRGRAELALLARRSFDARPLETAVAAGADPGVAALRGGAGRRALAAWSAWYAGAFSEPGDDVQPWDPERMEYRFRVAARPGAGGEILLDAPEYPGGHLDWDSFDVRGDLPRLGAPPAGSARRNRTIPVPVRVAGQAASRWWELEDADVWFGDIAVAPEDLARVAVAGFTMTFGDDWLIVPCRVATGELVRVTGLTVLDTFGERHAIRSCAEFDGPGRVWRSFELTGDPSADAPALEDRTCPWLLLAPALAGATAGRPVEEVLLSRDETANLGWAAELRVEGVAGRPVDRAALARAAEAPAPAPAADADAWRYRLATPVPEHLVPLVPVRSTRDGALYLQRGRIATSADAAGAQTRGMLGRILEPERALFICDEEVPATGVRITRRWQMARRADGGVVVWMGRRKGAAPPRRSPGLVFDDVQQ